MVAPHAGPRVVGKAIGPVALDHLAQDGRDELFVERGVDARLIAPLRDARPALGIHKEPVGVLAIERLRGAVRVHARQHREALLARRSVDLAVQVAVAQVFGAIVQRQRAGVVGDDPAGVDDHPLCARAPPVIAPPLAVIVGGIQFIEVGLSPAAHGAVPGLCAAHGCPPDGGTSPPDMEVRRRSMMKSAKDSGAAGRLRSQ